MSETNITLLPPSFSPWSSKKPASKQIALLMSGGVDSSCTAHLLKEDGWDVLGITMKIPVKCDNNPKVCCGPEAPIVCEQLDIPHYFIDVTEVFEQLVTRPFRQSYKTGRTPNPCVDCNTLLKFSLVWDFIVETFGIDYVATGHYAKISGADGQARLGRAADKTKDQSYFLYGIAAEKLGRVVFPLGDLTKQEVRSIAAELKLAVADKPESMELCFADAGDYRLVLPEGQVNKPGDITDMGGNKIGTHKGIANYTLGQRRGIGFAGGEPLYVGKMDAEKNTIALGAREEVCSRSVRAGQINRLIADELAAGSKVYGKIRSCGELRPCTITDSGEDVISIDFDQPQFAPCPGQRLVLYNANDDIIAGGTIVARDSD